MYVVKNNIWDSIEYSAQILPNRAMFYGNHSSHYSFSTHDEDIVFLVREIGLPLKRTKGLSRVNSWEES